MSRRLSYLAAPFAAALLAMPVGAQTIGGSSGCGGSPFLSCAIWSGVINSSTLTFTIKNTSDQAPALNPGSVFTTIGLGNITTTYNVSLQSVFVDGVDASSKWSVDQNLTGFNGFNLLADTFGADANAPGPHNGLMDGQTGIFTFTLAPGQTFSADAFLNYQVAMHDQGGFSYCSATSNKAVFNGTTGAYTGTAADCTPPNTVPEPSSMALLGTGLVGLVPMIRRRRK